ncbi:polyprenyl synthetase family protein, partial [Burkholderia gladioli]|nr:polyprenyl synthetase family protein [Burkholderia gladioli]
MTFEQWMRAVLARVEDALGHYLPAETVVPGKLHEAMRYAVMGGGKRVRPLLCHAAGELTGATEAARNAASAALEMIHVYSLVHDDMPCMDDDALRRGKPTVHIQYDEPTALLVGDALQSQAFVALTDAAALTAVQQAALVRELALASGSVGMAGG